MFSRSWRPLGLVQHSIRNCRHVHQISKSGFNDATADAYEQVRPTYPLSSVQYIKEVINNKDIPSALNVLELGAGTGKFTRSFLETSLESTLQQNLHYTATEPSDGFREVLAKSAPSGVSHIMAATGDAIDVPSGSQDAVIVAQAFHWMASAATLREVRRVLKPGGAFIMVWNALDANIPWINELEMDILTRRYDDKSTPRYITMDWEKVFSTAAAKSSFSPLIKWSNPVNACSEVTAQFIVDRMLSVSVVAMRSKEEQEAMAKEIVHLLKTHPTTSHLLDGKYTMEYRSDVAFCRAI
jgi:ubiquinone/menaquinone biosynthesis C-methylase UbiE